MKYKISISLCAIVLLMALAAAFASGQTSLNGPIRGSANVKDITVGKSTQDNYPSAYSIQGTSVYYSNNGAAWSATQSIPVTSPNPQVLACHVTIPTWVVAASLDNSSAGYVHYSSNGGQSWSVSNISQASNFVPYRLAAAPLSKYMLLGTKKFAGQYSMFWSQDTGRSWQNTGVFYSTYVTDITALTYHVLYSQYALAGGTGATNNGVYYSTDYGANWLNSGNLGKNVKAVVLYPGGGTYAFAGTDNSTYKLYCSTNPYSQSATWTQISFPGGLITDLQWDVNIGLVAATANGVYISSDNGASWSTCEGNFFETSNFTRVGLDSHNLYRVYAGNGANCYLSTDGGGTWRDFAASTTNVSTSAIAVNGSVSLGVPTSYSLLDRNAGSGWYPLSVNCYTDFQGTMLKFKAANGVTVYEAGYHSTGGTTASLLRSTSRGDVNSWSQIRYGSYTSGKYNGVAIDPVDTNILFTYGLAVNNSAGNNENLAKSVDGGSGWNKLPIPNNSNSAISEVTDFAVDSTAHGANTYSLYLYAAIYSGQSGDIGFWRSTAGGTSWTRTISTPVHAIAVNPKIDSVYAAGQDQNANSKFWKSKDKGANWRELSGAPTGVTRILMDAQYPTLADVLWVISDSGTKVKRSVDGGANWSDMTGTLSGTFYDIRMDISFARYIYVATSNGGYAIDPPPFAPTGLYIRCSSSGACVCEGNSLDNHCHPKIYWSSNGEPDMNVSGASYSVYRSTSPNTGYSYIGGSSYTSLSYVDAAINLPAEQTYYYKVTAVPSGGTESPMSNYVSFSDWPKVAFNNSEHQIGKPPDYELLQNSPNPFNPTTSIEYTLQDAGKVTLKVYDLLGNEVATLVDGYQSAGSKSATLDASRLPSGIYFYRIQSGKFIAIKKMVLMK